MNNKTKSIMPHIGMRKFKSILSVFIDYWYGRE